MKSSFLLLIFIFIATFTPVKAINFIPANHISNSYTDCDGRVNMSFVVADYDGINDFTERAEIYYWDGNSYTQIFKLVHGGFFPGWTSIGVDGELFRYQSQSGASFSVSTRTSNGGDLWWIDIVWNNIPQNAIQSSFLKLRFNGFYNGDGSDAEVDWGNEDRTMFLPNVPTITGFTATNKQECSQITLSWNNPTGTCTANYQTEIYRNNVLIATKANGITSHIDNVGLVKNTDYNYSIRIKQSNTNVSSYFLYGTSSTSVGRLVDIPSVPAGLTATNDRCDGKIVVNWNWNDVNPDNGFYLERSLSNTFSNPTVTILSGDKRSYFDTDVIKGLSYYYRIKARNQCYNPNITVNNPGESNFSSSVVGVAVALPERPTDVQVITDSVLNTFTIKWKDNTNLETQYLVERTALGGGVNTFELEPNDTMYIDRSAASCTNYLFKVKVYSACATTGISSQGSVPALLTPNLANTFDNVTNKIKASKGYYSDRIELSWNNRNTAQLNQFRVFRKIQGSNADSTLIGTVNAGSGLYIDNTGVAGVMYKYTIIGETQCAGTTKYSNTSEDVGFRSPSGLINGSITYAGGFAVKGVKVSAVNASGSKGSSMYFNGTNNVLTVPHSATLMPGSALTIESWVKPVSRKSFSIVSKLSGLNGYRLSYDSLSNAVEFYIYGNSTTKKLSVNNPFTTFNQYNQLTATFASDSLKLYINGVLKGSLATGNTTIGFNNSNLYLGAIPSSNIYLKGYLDEVRIWSIAKTADDITNDFNRTVNPDNNGLVAYWTFDERVNGITQFFDNSNFNYVFNENHGTITGASFSDSIPSTSQLSLASYTDENGYYSIANVRYSGIGQNFTIVPSYATHSFSPISRAIFIGDNSQIQNGIDFTDNSSFDFTGNVNYAGTSCPASGANIYIDGSIVIQAGLPLTVAGNGQFSVRVPIGNHVISLAQNNHVFSAGRFPSTGTYNFQSPVTAFFTDSTVLKVVGRVVGGNRELNKVAGLGRSKNNIGKAQFTFASVGQFGLSNCNTANIITNDSTGEYTAYLFPLRYNINGLKLVNNPDLTLLTNASLNNPNILDLTSIPSVTTVVDTFRNGSISRVDQTSYHKRLDFKYFVTPQIFVTKQQTPFDTLVNDFIGESTLRADDTIINVSNNDLGYPVFVQSKYYSGKVKVVEIYSNADKSPSDPLRFDRVPVSGTLNFFNNLATGDDTTRSVYINNGLFNYTFRGGNPNQLVSSVNPNYSFTKTFQIQFVPDLGITVDWKPNQSDLQNQFYRAYVFGAKSGGANFTTSGPAIVDLILRDPPGSASFSQWQSSKSIVNTSSFTLNHAEDFELQAQIFTGTRFSVGVGTEIETAILNNVSVGVNQSWSKNTEGDLVETITNTTTISTSADPSKVGSQYDLFYGKASNIIFGISDNIGLMDTATCRQRTAQNGGVSVCYGNVINGQMIGLSKGMYLVPGEVKTTFVYTTDEIENQVIPSLVDLRNRILNRGTLNKRGVRKYTPVFTDDTDPDYAIKFGSNNDDPIWGSLRVNTDPISTNLLDSVGPSYTFSRDTIYEVDSITYYNTQIRLWKEALARNEREKYQVFKDTSVLAAAGGRNISIGSAAFQQDFTTQTDSTYTISYELQLGGTVGTEFGFNVGGTGVGFSGSISYNQTRGSSQGTTSTNVNTFTYFLQDGDDGNLISTDIVDGRNGNGHVFRLRAGRTSCPFEGAVNAHYFDPDNDTITATTYIENGVELSAATARIEVPVIDVAQQSVFNIPATQAAVFTLELGNLSEARQDVDYNLRVDESTNPYGAIIKVDGLDPNRTFTVPYGTTIQKTLTLERGPLYYDYNNIRLILKSTCDDNIFDTISISAKFLPTCTPLNLKSPNDRWVLNSSFKDTLPVLIGDYNYNFGGFQNVYFQYKPASGSVWFNEKSYFKDTANTDLKIPVGTPSIFYPFNFKNLPDGNYEIRALSECTAPGYPNTKVSSSVLQGVADRVNPHPFGNPQPADGILSPNDEISIQFNEPIDNASLSNANFDIRGVLNGTSYQSSSSLYFDGDNDYVEIPNGLNIQKRSFTVEFWAKRAALGKQITFSQGTDSNEFVAIGFDENDKFCFYNNYEKVMSNTASLDLTSYHHYAASYDFDNEKVELFIDGILVNTGNTNFYSDYMGGGKTFFAKKASGMPYAFKGNLREFRLWNKTRTATDITALFNKTLKGTEAGIAGNWRIDEADGNTVKDYIRSRNGLIVNATWEINPAGRSYNFSGTNSGLKVAAANLTLNVENDFTLEFWFKANNTANNVCLFSNGKGDSTDLSPELKWSIQKDENGKIIVIHKNTIFEAVSTNYFDGNWHHFALIMQRASSLSAYIDGNLQNTTLPGQYAQFGGNAFWLGARGFQTQLNESTDKSYTGKLDEIRLWSIARTQEQITRDRLNRLAGTEPGLICYLPFESYVFNLGVPILSPSLTDVLSATRVVNRLDSASDFSAETPRIKLPRPVQAINFNYVVNNDKIILTPTTSQELIENTTLDITVKNIYDLHGNTMQSPKTWIAYLDKNQVKWQDETFSFVTKAGASQTFTSTIVNSGGAVKQYTIDNLPAWLSTSSTTGIIQPNSSKTISFTISSNTNIGDYEQDIHLTTDFNYPEKLNVKLKVYAEAPASWSVNTSAFTTTMNIIGQVRINNIISTNTDNKLAAFVNGQCRGVANVQYFPQYDRYLVFLSVSSNVNTGETIEFRIWNASEGKIHADVQPSLTFVANDLVGNIAAPIIFNASDKTIRLIPLQNGWNWVSFNLLMPDSASLNKLFAGINPGTGTQIKNNTELAIYDSTIGWSGNLANFNTGIKPEKSYLFYALHADTLTIKGVEPNPVLRPIDIQAGWNWLGFISQRNITVNEAFGSYNPRQGDILKNQTQFAIYDNTMGWVGSLNTMKPNTGYLYKTDTAGTLVYPRSGMFGKKQTTDETNITSKFWTCNPYAFNSNMNIVSKVNVCTDMLASGNWLLGGFVNGELRGLAKAQAISNNNYAYFITIGGNAAENIVFKLLDETTGNAYTLNENLVYQANSLNGDINKPFSLTTRGIDCIKTAIGKATNFTNVYPVPCHDILNIELNLLEAQNVTVNIYDLSGKLIRTLEQGKVDKGNQIVTWNISNLNAGMYTINIITANETFKHKVIKY